MPASFLDTMTLDIHLMHRAAVRATESALVAAWNIFQAASGVSDHQAVDQANRRLSAAAQLYLIAEHSARVDGLSFQPCPEAMQALGHLGRSL